MKLPRNKHEDHKMAFFISFSACFSDFSAVYWHQVLFVKDGDETIQSIVEGLKGPDFRRSLKGTWMMGWWDWTELSKIPSGKLT